jgi:anaerobic selenocysteine-containing dehydrogenase/Fe-S-cluster-containing dehydrogenase component
MIERRAFLKTLGLAGSAAMIESCAKGTSDELIPYFVSAEDVVAGVPAYYATTCRACPAGCGMVVKSLNGRVVKAEGHPENPIGRGRLCARGQGSVQSLYNPYRFRQPGLRDARGVLRPVSWKDAEAALASKLHDARSRGSNRIAWIGRLETGPFEDLVGTWLTALGSNRRLAYEAFDYHGIKSASEIAFGRAEIPEYDFDRAEFVLAFGAEFLETWISNVEFTNAYARLRARRVHDPDGALLWIAPRLSLTGLNADGWIPAAPGSEAAIAYAIASAMVSDGLAASSVLASVPAVRTALDRFTPERVAQVAGVSAESIHTAARRFARRGASLALGGGVAGSDDRNGVALEVAVLLLNALNANIGSTLTFGRSRAINRLSTPQQIAELVEAMRAGAIDVLLVHHTNPSYTLPAMAGFESALHHVPLVVAFSSLQDETTDRAHLVLPDHHDLESWGTYAPRDDIVGSLQPAALPLFDTRATADVLIEVAQQIDADVAATVGATGWRERLQNWWGADHERIVQDGGSISASVPPPPVVSLRDTSSTIASTPFGGSEGPDVPVVTFIAYPTTQLFDGRHADVSWLEELPDPVNKTVWGNCVEIHPDTSARLGIANDDEVEITSPYGRITARAKLYAGLHPNAIAMAIGYGRTASMRFAAPGGANAIRLLGPPAAGGGATWRSSGVTLRRTSGGRRLIVLQAETAARPDGEPASAKLVPPQRVDQRNPEAPKTVQYYRPHEHPEHRWGMAIDLNACTGCSACVVACYAENNIAVVGPELCEQGREMSWIRIEREAHAVKDADGIKTPGNAFLPMLCQQCDNAPCESVCPVYATYHNPEGLNAQVYVRCIGTRFCSNNCPYKVRRFNWARYTWAPPLEQQLNPDVTVRSVGVMEKCTFCVQRIQAGKLDAKREQRGLRDGEIVPACAQTCPADAIVFGDLHDPTSRVSQLSGIARGYRALEELNTKPAITYLRRVVPGAPEDAA